LRRAVFINRGFLAELAPQPSKARYSARIRADDETAAVTARADLPVMRAAQAAPKGILKGVVAAVAPADLRTGTGSDEPVEHISQERRELHNRHLSELLNGTPRSFPGLRAAARR
jgi:hypothetical protein